MLYLVITKKGYCLGFSEIGVKRGSRCLGATGSLIKCYSYKDAQELVDTFFESNRLGQAPKVMVGGKAVLFEEEEEMDPIVPDLSRRKEQLWHKSVDTHIIF